MDKLKKAIQQGNHEGARIYGQDAIREKNQALNHLRMASRLDACCSRIETAVRMNQVSAGMKGVVRGMDKSLAAMDIEQLSKVMDKFESQFEDLDVKVCVWMFGDKMVSLSRTSSFFFGSPEYWKCMTKHWCLWCWDSLFWHCVLVQEGDESFWFSCFMENLRIMMFFFCFPLVLVHGEITPIRYFCPLPPFARLFGEKPTIDCQTTSPNLILHNYTNRHNIWKEP